MKYNLVVVLIIYVVQYSAAQVQYSGSIRLDKISRGFDLKGSDKSEINFRLKNDTVPTLTINGTEIEFIASRFKFDADTIIIKSNETKSKLVRIQGGYLTSEGTKYLFQRCKMGEWIWCGGVELNPNYINGSYNVIENKSKIKFEISSDLKDKEIAVFMISRLIFESRLIYNVKTGKGSKIDPDSDTFWLIHLTSNL